MATRLLSLTAITAGEKISGVLASKYSLFLCSAIKSHSSPYIRSLIIRALGVLCFVGLDNQQEILDLLSFLEDLLKEHQPKASQNAPKNHNGYHDEFDEEEEQEGEEEEQEEEEDKNGFNESRLMEPQIEAEALLQTWGFLLTILFPSTVNQTVFPRFANNLIAFLQHDSQIVRQAAGENIALLIEFQTSEDDEFSIHDLEEIDAEDLLATLKDLSTSSSRHTTRRDRNKQKTSFKAIYSSIAHGTEPGEVLTLKHQTVQLSGWNQLKQLSLFRDTLAFGFHQHFAYNEFLQDVFDTPINPKVTGIHLTHLEKRKFKSPNAEVVKDRKNERNLQRSKRAVAITTSED